MVRAAYNILANQYNNAVTFPSVDNDRNRLKARC